MSMKHLFAGLGALLACWTVAPTAQQTPPVNEPAHKIFVLTGCLEGSADATSIFKLTRSSSIGQPPSTPAAGASAAAGARGEYLLQPTSGISEQGVDREQLQRHVGKRVEVTIRPAEPPSPPAPSASAKPAGSTAKKEELAPQRYTVVKISSLADACS